MQCRIAGYRTYILRLRRADNGLEAVQRALLRDLRTGERHRSTDLAEAVRYNEQEMAGQERGASGETGASSKRR